MEPPIVIGRDSAGTDAVVYRSMLTRHGLISGATGTGKTVTLQRLAQECAAGGAAVFLADVKGDLSGLALPAQHSPAIASRLQELGIAGAHSEGASVTFFDIFAERGIALRTTVSEVGPLLLAHMLELNDTQEGVLHVVFEAADREGLLLLDLKDLGALLTWVAENHKEVSREIGQVHPTSIGAIQRKLLVLRESGGEHFFGEPALVIDDLIRHSGPRGSVTILDARRLVETPRIYGAFLIWLLSELFEALPEVGDLENPKLVFFFDEAHLLFSNATGALLDRIAQVVRLIRSKGVGVFFITQHPLDIDQKVLSQLGNRVQHALRAFTPQERKMIKAVAETFPNASAANLEDEILALGVGEALVSTLNPKGVPSEAVKAKIIPPQSQIGAVNESERQRLIRNDGLFTRYARSVDRESAYEVLKARELVRTAPEPGKSEPRSTRQSHTEAFFKSILRSIGSTLGREIIRGVLGSISGRGRR